MRLLVAILILFLLAGAGCDTNTSEEDGFHVIENVKSLDILYKGQLITSYLFEDSLKKPVFYPVRLPSGSEFTRAYPLRLKEGERVDHPHHIGIWFTYGEVNGIDFWTSNWNNENGRDPRFGRIVHRMHEADIPESGQAVELIVASDWLRYNGDTVVIEADSYQWQLVDDRTLIFDRTTIVTAQEDLVFEDSKEGMYAIRVARGLEQPENKPQPLVDSAGGVTKVQQPAGAYGWYTNSKGLQGDQVWGQQAKWVKLTGKVDQKDATVLFADHPGNPGYPTYWMARGYGLFGANPLGRHAYSGLDSLNLSLDSGQSLTFRYRLIFHEGIMSDSLVAELTQSWMTEE